MRLLLDTHVFLWAAMQPARLSRKVRSALEDPATELLVSAASAWEIATKFRLGKLPAAAPIIADMRGVVERLDAGWLAISYAHAITAGAWVQPHRDPFDRMLAAQSELEGIPLVSKDPALRQFGVEVMW